MSDPLNNNALYNVRRLILGLFSLPLLNADSHSLFFLDWPAIQNLSVLRIFVNQILADLNILQVFLLVRVNRNLRYVATLDGDASCCTLIGAFHRAHEIVNRDYLDSRVGSVALHNLVGESEPAHQSQASAILRKFERVDVVNLVDGNDSLLRDDFHFGHAFAQVVLAQLSMVELDNANLWWNLVVTASAYHHIFLLLVHLFGFFPRLHLLVLGGLSRSGRCFPLRLCIVEG